MHEEKISAIEEKLELSEQKLAQQAKLQPDMEEQLKARMEALTKVGNKVWMCIVCVKEEINEKSVNVNFFQIKLFIFF